MSGLLHNGIAWSEVAQGGGGPTCLHVMPGRQHGSDAPSAPAHSCPRQPPKRHFSSFCADPLDWQGSDNPKVEGSKDAQDVKLALGECLHQPFMLSHCGPRGYCPALQAMPCYVPERLTERSMLNACVFAGLTAENVAEKYHVEREAQDRLAAASHAKAAAAQACWGCRAGLWRGSVGGAWIWA